MTSAQRIKANRANARASTGPKTAHGRLRAGQNARRHGLSLPIDSDPLAATQIETLARAIADGATGEIYQLARRVAEAQVAVLRVRHARHQVLAAKLNEHYVPRATIRWIIAHVCGLSRTAPDVPVDMEAVWAATPRGPEKIAITLSEEIKGLLLIDRYERRALSRRKSAIRAFDLAQRRAHES